MRVLWFEVTVPKSYQPHGFHGGGWQDALEKLVKNCEDIELGIAFESNYKNAKKIIKEGVQYYPLTPKYNFLEQIKEYCTFDVSRNKLIPLSLEVIEDFAPDVIHVFGSEWCFGQVAEFCDVPVVIHMQGSIPPYNNAFYPPGYNVWDEVIYNVIKFKWHKLIRLYQARKKQKSREKQELKTLAVVTNYMGRTKWDENIVKLFNPTCNYYYCSEALRPHIFNHTAKWKPTNNEKMKLVTVGCSSLWKGLDTIIKTSKLLKKQGVDFEWSLAGNFSPKGLVEWKEKVEIEKINIKLVGMLNEAQLIELLLESDIYIHTAYIDNSPNSICEAQFLGLPIIATYVGGIPSLINNNIDGLLIPANAPFTLTAEIRKLFIDKERQLRYSTNSKQSSINRHNPENITKDLLNVYTNLMK